MSAFRPTEEQTAAIRHPLADACVVAGAGSGKTAVLTQRFLHLHREYGIPIRRIAALTFTEKAAAEMRERIAAGLSGDGSSPIADDVEFAPISTIHAFCARLLRLHAVEAGLDPAFVVLDETESLLLREDAWRAARVQLAAQGSPAPAVLGRIAAGEAELLGLVERVRGAGRHATDLAWHAGSVNVEAEPAAAREALAELEREAAAQENDAVVERAEVARDEVLLALSEEDAPAWRLLAARDLVGAVKVPGRRPRKLAACRKALQELLDRLAGAALDAMGNDSVAGSLRELLVAYEAEYERRKDERSALDFTDLEGRALALLDALAESGREPAQAPRALLVDEFQDTNPLQARLLERLRTSGAPMFSVGDPKQSIYRFRRADVRVITAEKERVGEAGRHLLRATFRARPGLVDVLNGLNERLFAEDAAGVEHEPLSAEGTFREGDGPDVEMVVIDAGKDSSARIRREAEARWIALRIRDLVDSGTPRTKTERAKDGTLGPGRPLRFGDVAILVRARTNLAAYEDALAALDIPFHTHKGRGFFQAEEITDLVHALRVVRDVADDHALACLLTGPIVAATDEDLLGWFPDPTDRSRREAEGESRRAWDAFAAEGSGRPAAVVQVLERLRREAVLGNLGRVVEGVLYDLGLLEAALLQPDGARRAANLRKAVAIARDLGRTGHHDLGDLLRHLGTLRDREVAEAVASFGDTSDDRVLINTVHGAKGLEHGVVFVADVGRQPPSSRESLLFDGDRGFACSLRHPLEGSSHAPAGLTELKEREKELQAQEDLRLLYVAMTRAEEHLVLSGSCEGTRKKDGAPSRFLGWGAALLDAFDAPLERAPREIVFGAGRASVALLDPPVAPRSHSAAAFETVVRMAVDVQGEDAEAATALLARAARPVAPLAGTPFVVTVTDLLRFARSPADLYLSRLEPRLDSATAWAPAEPEDPQSGLEHEDPEALRRQTRRELFDEEYDEEHDEGRGEDAPAGGRVAVDRAALGRAVHALIERLRPGRLEGPDEEDLADVIAQEFPSGAPAAVPAALRAMVTRFLLSRTGSRFARALDAGEHVLREVAFHVRIRFPAGERVGPFDSLLVRGSIDLWLPAQDGYRVVDHKTNAPSASLPTPEAVAAHYDWQLRLYALAAERMLGRDVREASLLLLDGGWGEEAVEVPVDVSGPSLEDARRLCRAYALAELEGRWPSAWRSLLA